MFAFIQNADRDASQQEFVSEVEHWQTGLFRQSFGTMEALRSKMVRALREWALSSATAPLDPKDLLQRVASMSSMGLFAPIGEVDMKSAPGLVRASRTDRRSDRSRP
jgi:hypothetical protein